MENTANASPVVYAGFWRRFAAMLIDSVILGALHMIVIVPVLGMIGIGAVTSGLDSEGLSDQDQAMLLMAMISGAAVLYGVLAVIGWLYYALMESGSRQATIGKIALGLKVTDLQGERISFLRATGRYFGKIISGMILYIGFIMAAFTERRQALHDLMAECLVVSNNPQ
jgi:uncharacterized RDD family membrane protein YckC